VAYNTVADNTGLSSFV